MVFGPVIPGQLGDEKEKSSRSSGMGHLVWTTHQSQSPWHPTERESLWDPEAGPVAPRSHRDQGREDFWVPYKVGKGCPPPLPP